MNHVRIRRLAAGLALGSLLTGSVASAQDIGQVIVTDIPSGTTVALHAPAQPQTQTVPSAGIEIRFYLAVTGDIASTLSVFEASDELGFDIDGSVQGSAQGSGGTLLSCTAVSHQGYPARDFVVDVTDASGASGILESRIVYTGAHVVQVQALGSDAQTDTVDRLFAQLTSTLDIPATAGASPATASESPAAAGASPGSSGATADASIAPRCLLPVPVMSAAPAG